MGRVFVLSAPIAYIHNRRQYHLWLFKDMTVFVIFFVLVFSYTSVIHTNNSNFVSIQTCFRYKSSQFSNIGLEELDKVQLKFEIWLYLSTTFTHCLYKEQMKDSEERRPEIGGVLMMGAPRLRQLRTKTEACSKFNTQMRCYQPFDEMHEETKTLNRPKNTYRWFSPEETGSPSYKHFHGGGYCTVLKLGKNEMLQSINDLVADEWIEPETRVVFLDFLQYNYYTNVFILVKVIFEIDVTGVVTTNIDIKGLHAHSQENGKHTFDYMTIVIAVFLFYFVVEELNEMIYFKQTYFKNIGNFIDVVLIVVGFVTLVYRMYCTENYIHIIEAVKKNPENYVDMEHVANKDALIRHLMGCFLFFCYMKLFRYLNFHRSLGILNETISRCFTMLFICSVQLILVILIYAYIGMIVFGTRCQDYATLGAGFFTLFRTINGDFSYKEIKKSNPHLALCFFFSYLALVFFIFLNIFVAIIGETFSDVKQEIAMTADYVNMSDYMKIVLSKLKLCKLKNDPISDYKRLLLSVRNSLKNVGFTDQEIEIYFATKGIDIHAQNETAENLLKALEKSEDSNTIPDAKQENDLKVVTVSEMNTRMKRLEDIDMELYYLSEKYNELYTILFTHK